MRQQDKEQTQVLVWTATAALFLFVVFRLKIMENIEHSPYTPWIALLLLIVQIISHEQATNSLRKKSPNFTNNFYAENGRMVLGNLIASAVVLEFNSFNYESLHINYGLEIIGIIFLMIVIFFIENSQGGFLNFKRIYFPKKWDMFFKSYGIDIISIIIMLVMWIPVIFKVPMSPFMWIFISTLLLKSSIIYTNKYNHVGWCFLLEGLLVLQLLTLGLQENQIIFLIVGILAGIGYFVVYMKRMKFENLVIAVSIVLFTSGIIVFDYYLPKNISIIYYLQVELILFILIFTVAKFISSIYRKYIKVETSNKYSYSEAVVDRNLSIETSMNKKIKPRKKTILLKKAEGKSEKIKAKKRIKKTNSNQNHQTNRGKPNNQAQEAQQKQQQRKNSNFNQQNNQDLGKQNSQAQTKQTKQVKTENQKQQGQQVQRQQQRKNSNSNQQNNQDLSKQNSQAQTKQTKQVKTENRKQQGQQVQQSQVKANPKNRKRRKTNNRPKKKTQDAITDTLNLQAASKLNKLASENQKNLQQKVNKGKQKRNIQKKKKVVQNKVSTNATTIKNTNKPHLEHKNKKKATKTSGNKTSDKVVMPTKNSKNKKNSNINRNNQKQGQRNNSKNKPKSQQTKNNVQSNTQNTKVNKPHFTRKKRNNSKSNQKKDNN